MIPAIAGGGRKIARLGAYFRRGGSPGDFLREAARTFIISMYIPQGLEPEPTTSNYDRKVIELPNNLVEVMQSRIPFGFARLIGSDVIEEGAEGQQGLRALLAADKDTEGHRVYGDTCDLVLGTRGGLLICIYLHSPGRHSWS